jgi:hypothetical protein
VPPERPETVVGPNGDATEADENDCPEELRCPITREPFRDPVMTSSGAWHGVVRGRQVLA